MWWAILGSILLGMTCKDAPVIVASCLKVVAHVNMGLLFCWVIVVDASGYRNGFVRFLSGSFFVRYAKTTYATYLIGPIVTFSVYGLTRSGTSNDVLETVSA
jgi:hypothetical protein